MTEHLSSELQPGIDQIFLSARTYHGWKDEPVSLETLKEVYQTMKFAPTSANSNPFRIVFLMTPESKARIIPAMMEANREKTRTSPVVAIFAYATDFYEKFETLYPGRDWKSMFVANPAMAEKTALQGGHLQAAYFMLAARAHGLDCGPMGGFDAAAVEKEFFPDGLWKVTFVCNLGHGDPSSLHPRLPRLSFEEVARVL